MNSKELTAEGFTMNLSMRILEDEEIVSGGEGNLYANRRDDRSLSYSMIAYDIIERFNPAAQDAILEVCCGAGNLAHFIYKHSGNKNISATDGSKELIRAAKKKYEHDPIQFEVQDVHHHEVRGLQDLVVCMDSFHHFTDPIQSLRKLIKLVKPGGILYLIDLTRECPADLVRRRQETIMNPHEQKRFLKSVNASFTPLEMEKNLSLAGAKDYQVIYPRKFSEENVAYHAEWIANDSIKENLYEETFLICIVKM